MLDISIVIPLYNEEESLPELFELINGVMNENNYSFEVLFIDDGSTDSSWSVVENLAAKCNHAKGIRFRRNYGKSAALNVGFAQAAGDVVITMDADLQDNPDEIPDLYRLITEEKYDLISGWKKKRYDPPSKTIPTKLFNWATRKMSGIYLHDFNCGLKAYRNDVIKCVEVYGEMHRYIPVLAKQAGFIKIGEKVVQHQARKYGSSKFGMNRFINGFLDLLTITFISSYGKKPMHFFGLLGTFIFILGFGITAWLGIDKLWHLQQGIRKQLIAQNPLFYIALTTMIMGTLLFLAGFLGELISRNAPDRNTYHIKEKKNLA